MYPLIYEHKCYFELPVFVKTAGYEFSLNSFGMKANLNVLSYAPVWGILGLVFSTKEKWEQLMDGSESGLDKKLRQVKYIIYCIPGMAAFITFKKGKF